MTLVPPVLVTVPDRDWLLPTVTVPKLRLEGIDPKAPAAIPLPDNATVSVGFDAVELTVRVPLAVTADAGVNLMVSAVLWPPASVIGVLTPLMLNPVPLMAAWVIVTLEPPVLVTVSVRD